MRSARSEAAKDLLNNRKLDKQILELRRDTLKIDPNFDRSLLPKANLSEGSLKLWKEHLKGVEDGHRREKQIMDGFEGKLNGPLSKKAKTRLGIGAGIAAAGLGYAAYKHYKDKKKENN